MHWKEKNKSFEDLSMIGLLINNIICEIIRCNLQSPNYDWVIKLNCLIPLYAIILDHYQVIDTTWRERRRMMPGSEQNKVRDKRESERISINLGVKVGPEKNIRILSFHSLSTIRG